MLRRSRFAWGLAGILPVGLFGVGGADAAFTDAAPISGVSVSAATVPTVALTCTTAGATWPLRTATFSWPSQGAGYSYALRIFSGATLVETRNLGSATSWQVPTFYGSGTFGVRLVVSAAQGTWVGAPSTASTGFSQPGLVDTTCVSA